MWTRERDTTSLTPDEDLLSGFGVLMFQIHLDGGAEEGILALDLCNDVGTLPLGQWVRLLCGDKSELTRVATRRKEPGSFSHGSVRNKTSFQEGS